MTDKINIKIYLKNHKNWQLLPAYNQHKNDNPNYKDIACDT